jgi:hypothetical protein
MSILFAMKVINPLLAALFLSFLFFGCRKKQAKVPPHIATQLDGFWMAADYLEHVEETKSVYGNRNYKETFFGFVLDKMDMEEGRLQLHGMSEHENGFDAQGFWNEEDQRFYCSAGESPQDSFSLWLTRSGKVKCFFFNRDKKESYRRAKTPKDALRKALFETAYESFQDSLNIRLGKRGYAFSVKETPISRFEVNYDFVDGPKTDFISLYKLNGTEPYMYFAFDFVQDTLLLTEFTQAAPDWQLGTYTYKLLPKSKLPAPQISGGDSLE